jgi:hypothetical protein
VICAKNRDYMVRQVNMSEVTIEQFGGAREGPQLTEHIEKGLLCAFIEHFQADGAHECIQGQPGFAAWVRTTEQDGCTAE